MHLLVSFSNDFHGGENITKEFTYYYHLIIEHGFFNSSKFNFHSLFKVVNCTFFYSLH